MPETVTTPKSPDLKTPTGEKVREEFPHHIHDELEHGEYIVGRREQRQSDDSGSDSSGLKTTANGSIVLIPQPSDDPDDPLNWPWIKKHAVLLSLIPGCLLTDGVITWGSVMFEVQAHQWMMTPPDVSHSISGSIFMQGPGGLMAVPLAQRYGRLPVLFWSQFVTLIATIGATYSTNYAGFTACRTIQGWSAAAPQVIGLSIIHDMFFFHERARKINIWAFSFLLGPYIAPFLAGFILQGFKGDWVKTFGILCAFYGLSVLMVVFIGDETLYNREGIQKPREKGIIGRVKLLTGISGIQNSEGRPGLWEVTKDLFGLLSRPYLTLALFFVTIQTMPTIGIVSTISLLVKPPPYLFSNTALSLVFLAPCVGTILGELWGHFFNDFVAKWYIRTHGGKFRPEVRLWGVYTPWIIGLCGLILFGQALKHHLFWFAMAAGWAMNTFSTLGSTTAISAYFLDVMPQHAALTAAWLNAFRTIGGFTVVYFQTPWITRNGPAVTFGCQAAIVAAFVVSIIVTQLKGSSWRQRFPPPATSRTS